MLIKIEDIPTVPLHSSSLQEGEKQKHRDISWLCIDAVVYSWAMMSAEDVTDEMRENVDHHIIELRPLAEDLETGKPIELDYDEVCLLEIHDPVQISVLFNTRAYLCNSKGDTIEKIVPKRITKARKLLKRAHELIKDMPVEVVHPNLAEHFKGNNEPPCLKCAKKAIRLVEDGVFIGTHCEDCGEQHFEYYDAPRQPKSKVGEKFGGGVIGAKPPNEVKLPESFPPDKKLGQP